MENFLLKNQKNNIIEKRKSNGFGDSNNIETLKNNFEILFKKIIDIKYNPQNITLNQEEDSHVWQHVKIDFKKTHEVMK